MSTRNRRSSRIRKLSGRLWLRFSLLGALAILVVVVYAGSVSGLLSFVNGEVADANSVNTNFSTTANAVNDNDTRVLTLEGLLTQSCPPAELATGFDGAGSILCAIPNNGRLAANMGSPLAFNFTPQLLIDQLLVEVLDQWLTDPAFSLAIDITGINGGFEVHGNDVIDIVNTSVFSTDSRVAKTVVAWTTDTVTRNVNEVYTVCVQVRQNTTQLIGAQKCTQFGPF